MSDYGLFWNSRGGDRLYNADSMEEWLKPFFVTGVFNGHLQVTATSGMGISVASGYCNVNGKVRLFDYATTFTLEAASGVADRVDTVVVERNDGEREITLKVVTGTPGEGATAPVRAGGIYQLVLAQIAVDQGATSITQADITDTRTSSELCGYVCSTVDEIDFDELMAQFNSWFTQFKSDMASQFNTMMSNDVERFNQFMSTSNTTFTAFMARETADFNSWFANLHYILDGDVAGHLQNEIDDIDKEIGLGNSTTTFNNDGSITQTWSDREKTTEFNGNIITETMKDANDVTIYTKTTTFNADGSITEEVE